MWFVKKCTTFLAHPVQYAHGVQMYLHICRANEEIAKVKRNNESEMVRLQAALRKSEMQTQSLEQTVEQKASFCFSLDLTCVIFLLCISLLV